MALVVDASVALKWLVAEDGSADALALRSDNDLFAPDLLLIECRNALLTKVRSGYLSVNEAHRAENDIDTCGLAILPSAPLLRQAFGIATDLGEPIYDCIYLVAAIATNCTLITADERFMRKVQKSAMQGRIRLL